MKQEHIMKVFWTEEAKIEFKQTLMYWTIHNMSDSYSKKIDAETFKLVKEITTSPYFLANYVETIDAYKRVFFKSRFILYYQVDEKNDTIYILHFRSSSQKPL